MNSVEQWFKSQNWEVQAFQKQCWKAYSQGKSGMLHAPTGSGKTYAIWGGIVEKYTVPKHSLKDCMPSGLHPYVL